MRLREHLYRLQGHDSTLPEVATAIRVVETDIAWAEHRIWKRRPDDKTP
jgi:hypothetical protein